MAKAKPDLSIDQRVAAVVQIIGRNKAHLGEIEETIRLYVSKQQSSRIWPPQPLTKRDKTTARSLALAVGRLEHHLSRPTIAEVLERVLYGVNNEFLELQAQLKRWRERFEAFGGVAEPEGLEVLFNWSTSWPLPRSKPPASKVQKHRAAAVAANILKSHGLHLTATHKSAKLKVSVFCRVAAVVYGDPTASVYHQCRAYIDKEKART